MDAVEQNTTDSILLNGQNRILEMIATGSPLRDTLTALLQFIESRASNTLGSILLLDEDGLHLRHGAAPCLPSDYTLAIDGIAIGPEVGSCGTAAYLRQPVFVEDIQTCPLWKDFKGLALHHGLRACWSTPIFDPQQQVIGTFAMYFREPALPAPEHLRLIHLTTHLASIAISRHRTETALRDSQERLRLAMQSSNVGLWDWDCLTDKTIISREWKQWLGYDEDDGWNTFGGWEKYIHPDDRNTVRRRAYEYLSCQIPEYSVEFRFIPKIGSFRWVFSRGEVHRDAEGKPVRLLGCFVDITERKLAEEEIRGHRDLLEELVAMRTQELTKANRELQTAREIADSASQAKSRFLANMGHELRSPLNAILGFTQIIKQDSPLTHLQRSGLRVIQDSGEHLLALISDILDLSRIEAQKVQLHLVEFAPATLIEKIEDVVRTRAESKGLTFLVETDPTIPGRIVADMTRLRQVLLNLLGNAVKFTEIGKILFRVELLALSMEPAGIDVRKQCTLRFTVEDTGIGIPAEHLNRIFLPFEQVESISNTEGTGLGLSISYQLVRLMGGEISVESQEGSGSTFRFDLTFPAIG